MIQKLYLFTSSFPYGNSENFIEDEINILSTKFDKIVIVPFVGNGSPVRVVPDNCIVYTPVVKNKWSKLILGMFSLRTLPYFVNDFIRQKVYQSKERLYTFMVAYINTNFLLNSKTIRSIEKSLVSGDLCYFYWGKGANLLSIFWRNKAKMISRFHGEWDLWEESCGNYAPVRSVLAESLDLAAFISSKGEKYFINRYNTCKTIVSRLGAFDNGISPKSNDEWIRIVSCSSVYSLKRVPLILESVSHLSRCGYKLIWTHLGGGVDFVKLKQLAEKEACNNLQINLSGQVSHKQVIQYFKSNPVDIFINLSTNEGVPVSIMEAISFNVPVVATNVGGTSEIVNDRTGILVSPNPTPVEVAEAMMLLCSYELSPRSFWDENFNAEKNYSEFADIIKQL